MWLTILLVCGSDRISKMRSPEPNIPIAYDRDLDVGSTEYEHSTHGRGCSWYGTRGHGELNTRRRQREPGRSIPTRVLFTGYPPVFFTGTYVAVWR